MTSSNPQPKSRRPLQSARSRPPAGKPRGSKKHHTAGAKAPAAAASSRAEGAAASRKIDERIRSLADWRGETLARMRALILAADPHIVEEWKWMGTPVWSRDGNICTGETYKQVVKLTFARGAALADPGGLFNSSLEGNTRRAIDLREGETVDARAFQALISAAVAMNQAARGTKAKPAATSGAKNRSAAKTQPAAKTKTAPAQRTMKAKATRTSTPTKPPAKNAPATKANASKKTVRAKTSGVVLLAGGNPQIAKADGDAPVQAYIAAMPGWKRALGERLDALVVRSVPKVHKAVKWNSPFYGLPGRGWFLSFHVFTRYVKVTFFAGASLRPLPPGGTERSKEARWIDIHEDQPFDEAQFAAWVKQAAALPGWLA